MHWIWWLRRPSRSCNYSLQLKGDTCFVTLYGAWDTEQTPLDSDRLVAELAKLEWSKLFVDCCRIVSLDGSALDTAFIATMVKLVRASLDRAEAKNQPPEWGFVFRQREQTMVLKLDVRLNRFFAGQVVYRYRRGRLLDFGGQVVVQSAQPEVDLISNG